MIWPICAESAVKPNQPTFMLYNSRVTEFCACHRWLEVVGSATSSSHMIRLFSRMESIQLSSPTAMTQPQQSRSEVYESDVV